MVKKSRCVNLVTAKKVLLKKLLLLLYASDGNVSVFLDILKKTENEYTYMYVYRMYLYVYVNKYFLQV